MTGNDIQVFSNSQFGAIRTIIAEDGEPRFCLADVCEALGLQQKHVSERLSKGSVSNDPLYKGVLSRYSLSTNGGVQQANFVNEDGLYDTIFESRKKEAKAFRKWVTSEVLPSIRKTGGYIAAKQDDSPEEIMARALLVAQSTLERQKKRLAEQDLTIERQTVQLEAQHKELEAAAPKVNYYDETLMSVNSLTMTQAANAIGMSVGALTRKLLQAGVVFRQSGQVMLRVPYCKWGLHQTRTHTYTRSDGSVSTNTYTVWTQKGMRFIHALNVHGFNVSAAVAELRREKEQMQAARSVQAVPSAVVP